jgi:methionyl-tRNA formyltransferase
MKPTNKLKVCLIAGKQAGIVGALTVLSKGNQILASVSYSDELTDILKCLSIPVYSTIDEREFIKCLANSDVLISVHGKEIVKPDLFKLPRLGSVNIHPYLYKYKGKDPVGRALKEREFKASVGAHVITEQIDGGRVLIEEFIDITGANSVEEIYNRLYPYYCSVILKVLDILCDEHKNYKK